MNGSSKISTPTRPDASSTVPAELCAGTEQLRWNQIGRFDYQEDKPLPPGMQALDGKQAGLVGYMITLGETDEVSEFILVESLWGCCFGATPGLHQTVVVEMKKGSPAPYTPSPVLVTGRFEVGEKKDGDFVVSVYRLKNAELRPFE